MRSLQCSYPLVVTAGSMSVEFTPKSGRDPQRSVGYLRFWQPSSDGFDNRPDWSCSNVWGASLQRQNKKTLPGQTQTCEPSPTVIRASSMHRPPALATRKHLETYIRNKPTPANSTLTTRKPEIGRTEPRNMSENRPERRVGPPLSTPPEINYKAYSRVGSKLCAFISSGCRHALSGLG